MNMDASNFGRPAQPDREARSGAPRQRSASYQGRYLNGSPQPVRKRRRRRRRRRLNPRFVLMLAVLLAILIGVALLIGLRGCSAKSSIEGRWDLDGTTVYEFYDDGKGALVLLTMTFDFDYTIQENMVYIDFKDDRALDSRYEFVIEGDMMMLTGGPGEAVSEYILKRDD